MKGHGRVKDTLVENDFSISRYLKLTGFIRKRLPKRKSKILDWGAGIGQVAFFLKEMGYDVTAFDIQKAEDTTLLKAAKVKYIIGGDKLPFKNSSFDGVTSFGVLEHVKNDVYSLKEIYRVLKKGGFLFIFNLPNVCSLSELFARNSGKDYHDHLYTKGEILGKLEGMNFNVLEIRHSHMMPNYMLGLDMKSRVYYRDYKQAAAIDEALERVPGLNAFSNEWLIIAQKR